MEVLEGCLLSWTVGLSLTLCLLCSWDGTHVSLDLVPDPAAQLPQAWLSGETAVSILAFLVVSLDPGKLCSLEGSPWWQVPKGKAHWHDQEEWIVHPGAAPGLVSIGWVSSHWQYLSRFAPHLPQS